MDFSTKGKESKRLAKSTNQLDGCKLCAEIKVYGVENVHAHTISKVAKRYRLFYMNILELYVCNGN